MNSGFEADLVASQQYYPFGMLMPKDASASIRRQYSVDGYDYRYGFNGKEGDDEVKGDDNQLDFGARPYDPRSGRWLSVDPLQQKYPFSSPYNAYLNNPIFYIDPDGKEIKPSYQIDNNGNLIIKIQVTGKVIDLSNKWFSPAESFAKELNASASNFNGKASGINVEFMGKKFTEATVNFEFDVRAADKISEISETDHLFVLAPYRNIPKQLASGITNMEGGKVMHIDADFASGPIDYFFDNGLKIGLHELFSHAMGAGHRNDNGTLTYGNDVTGRIGNNKLSDTDRGLIVNFIGNGKANAGQTLLDGNLGVKYPNMNVIGTDPQTGAPTQRTIGNVGFDIREEIKNSNNKQ